MEHKIEAYKEISKINKKIEKLLIQKKEQENILTRPLNKKEFKEEASKAIQDLRPYLNRRITFEIDLYDDISRITHHSVELLEIDLKKNLIKVGKRNYLNNSQWISKWVSPIHNDGTRKKREPSLLPPHMIDKYREDFKRRKFLIQMLDKEKEIKLNVNQKINFKSHYFHYESDFKLFRVFKPMLIFDEVKNKTGKRNFENDCIFNYPYSYLNELKKIRKAYKM